MNVNISESYADDLRKVLNNWEEATYGDSNDAEHEAGLALADAVRVIIADYDLRVRQERK